MAERTFFSYSRTDSAFALKLAKDLRHAGAGLWIDQLDIKAGSHWDASIEKALNAASHMIVILSPASVASNNVMDEVSFALENSKTVIPVLLIDCAPPFRLRRLQRIDFTGDYETGLKQLLEVLGHPVESADPVTTNERTVDEQQQKEKFIELSAQLEKEAIGKKEMDPLEQVKVEEAISAYEQSIKEHNHGVHGNEAIAAVEETKQQPQSNDLPEEIFPIENRSKKRYLLIGVGIIVLGLIIYNLSRSTHDRKLPGPDGVETSPISQDSSAAVLKQDSIVIENGDTKVEVMPEHKMSGEVFSKVEVDASFKGGAAAWNSYLQKNLNGSVPYDNGMKKAGKYTAIVKFIVSKDGSLSDITCETDPGFGMCQEAIRVIKTSPRWIPAKQNGRDVNCLRRQPITFMVE